MENGKYLASIMDKVICDDVIGVTETNFTKKKYNLYNKCFSILLTFLLITITLLIAVSIYCYLIKYRAKQKHLLLFLDTKLKKNQC